MTSALHAEGREFNPRSEQLFVVDNRIAKTRADVTSCYLNEGSLWNGSHFPVLSGQEDKKKPRAEKVAFCGVRTRAD